jgi:hypothetical protein
MKIWHAYLTGTKPAKKKKANLLIGIDQKISKALLEVCLPSPKLDKTSLSNHALNAHCHVCILPWRLKLRCLPKRCKNLQHSAWLVPEIWSYTTEHRLSSRESVDWLGGRRTGKVPLLDNPGVFCQAMSVQKGSSYLWWWVFFIFFDGSGVMLSFLFEAFL